MQLFVSIARQQMDLLDQSGDTIRTYPVSTSRFGLGSKPESNFTPLGRFQIAQKIGHGAPERTIFRSRMGKGMWDGREGPGDYVLTRILWLEGVEEENLNTFSRYIYIHGTNQESCIGEPASHGCIRLTNADVIDLFDRVDLATEVIIGDVPDSIPRLQEII